MQKIAQDGMKGWFAAFFLFALLLKALTPAGWMPVMGANGDDGIRLVVCTQNGLIDFSSDDEGKAVGAVPCLYAASGPVLLGAAAALFVPFAWASWVALPQLLAKPAAPLSDHALPPSTAPPAFR